MDRLKRYVFNLDYITHGKKMKIKITKLKELPDAKHPGNIDEGFERTGEILPAWFEIPIVGQRFWIDRNWSTSGVKEIIDEFTFRTYNSIYKYEIL